MTDKPPPLSTQIVPPSQGPPQDALHKQEAVEEEPYTIKCICDFSGDDGNTIYCDTCDTWQHIECYYPDNVEDALREDFAHSCAECKPRSLDRQQAIERQKSRVAMSIVEEEAADKKPKRPPSKSHKKKPKPTDLQLNGHAGPENPKNGSPNEHPHPPKKSKNSHKPSHSVSSQAPKRSPSYGNTRVVLGHPPSPATTPPDLPDDLEIHNYSSGFLSQYSAQEKVQTVAVNSFASLHIPDFLSSWLRDPDKMKKETGHFPDDVFQKLPQNIHTLKRLLEVESSKKVVGGNTAIQWQCLRASAAIGKDVPLTELNGQIGFQRAYCEDPENRWDEFTSPLPYVFFHPMLPLYIDTRREGSEARYARRSCRPNAVLETYTESLECRFWLVSDRPIAAKEQITIPWDFGFPKEKLARMLRILGLSEEDNSAQTEPVVDEVEYQQIATWVHLVLSEYGGCACNLGNECAFARFHRNFHGKLQSRPSAPKKKARKPKAPHTISPTSTGHATNSRAPSEGHLEDVPEQDARSVSGSSRSKPPSRDMTPTARQGSFDTLGILTEPTDRDKRKVAMVEDSFRRMEQQQPPRKKKRTSDGTNPSKSKSAGRPATGQTSNHPGNSLDRRYVDAGTSRSKSASPASVMSPHITHASKPIRSRHGSAPTVSLLVASSNARPSYRDCAVQTDPEEGAWYNESNQTSTPKRRIISLSKRLLDNRHRLRLSDEARQRQSPSDGVVCATAMEVDSPTDQQLDPSSPSPTKDEIQTAASVSPSVAASDITMTDAPAVSPSAMKPPTGLSAASPIKIKSPELRVQMPPVPSFGSPAPSGPTSLVNTPVSAGGSMVQSPFSTGLPSPFGQASASLIAANPSPVKKKLSLSDYKSRLSKAGARPSVGTSLKPVPNSEDVKLSTSIEIAGTAESPTAEKTTDPSGAMNPSSSIAATNGSM